MHHNGMLHNKKAYRRFTFMIIKKLLLTCAFISAYAASAETTTVGNYTLISSLPDSIRQERKTVDWSILICTLEERTESFSYIFSKLYTQICKLGLQDRIEILACRDNRENSVGFKRNLLLNEALGEYTCYVDDDDDIHDNYVGMLYEKILKKPDCVSLVGVITMYGQDPHLFIHSLKYHAYFMHNNIYYRPPNHLNPMKRSIALQVKFPEKIYGEDYDWTLKLHETGLIKTEEEVTVPYYHYKYDGKYHKKTDKLGDESRVA